MRLLVIEDDLTLRETLAELLRDEGHQVDIAGDGMAGLEQLEAAPPPDVIILDLMMRTMDGKQFRIAQLADARFAGIPTLVITAGHVDDQNRLVLGEAPVLCKPFSLDVLLAALAEITE